MNKNDNSGCFCIVMFFVGLVLLLTIATGGKLIKLVFQYPGAFVILLFIVCGFFLSLPYSAIGMFRWFWRK